MVDFSFSLLSCQINFHFLFQQSRNELIIKLLEGHVTGLFSFCEDRRTQTKTCARCKLEPGTHIKEVRLSWFEIHCCEMYHQCMRTESFDWVKLHVYDTIFASSAATGEYYCSYRVVVWSNIVSRYWQKLLGYVRKC